MYMNVGFLEEVVYGIFHNIGESRSIFTNYLHPVVTGLSCPPRPLVARRQPVWAGRTTCSPMPVPFQRRSQSKTRNSDIPSSKPIAQAKSLTGQPGGQSARAPYSPKFIFIAQYESGHSRIFRSKIKPPYWIYVRHYRLTGFQNPWFIRAILSHL